MHVARGFPCTAAVVFNTSCVTNRIRYSDPYMESQIVDIREDRDLLTNTLCAPAALLGWSSNHQLYGAEWIRVRRRANVDEMDLALRQHAIGGMAFAMGRTVLCCAQNQRRSSHESCACASRKRRGGSDGWPTSRSLTVTCSSTRMKSLSKASEMLRCKTRCQRASAALGLNRSDMTALS